MHKKMNESEILKRQHGMRKVISDEGANCDISSDEGICLGSIRHNDWATEFFGRQWGEINLNHKALNHRTIQSILNELLTFADDNHYRMLEYQGDISAFGLIPPIEGEGFRLVDTQITFFSKIEKPVSQRYFPEIGDIVLPNDDDLKGMLELTHQAFTNNDSFLSRFKNRTYFTEEDSARYYGTWISNNFRDKEVLFAVIKHKNRVISQLSFKPSGLEEEIRIYRAMFVAVDPSYRGFKTHLALISFLCDRVKETTFYLDSTTQLTNFPLIKNNIHSRRQLKSITLIFYRTPH
jgi:hypothetical protein